MARRRSASRRGGAGCGPPGELARKEGRCGSARLLRCAAKAVRLSIRRGTAAWRGRGSALAGGGAADMPTVRGTVGEVPGGEAEAVPAGWRGRPGRLSAAGWGAEACGCCGAAGALGREPRCWTPVRWVRCAARDDRRSARRGACDCRPRWVSSLMRGRVAAVPSGLGGRVGGDPCGEAEAVPAGWRGRMLTAMVPGEAAEAGLAG